MLNHDNASQINALTTGLCKKLKNFLKECKVVSPLKKVASEAFNCQSDWFFDLKSESKNNKNKLQLSSDIFITISGAKSSQNFT